ncbi:Tyrosine-protein phosphatase 1 [Pseudozyma hubeiensis]|nr:Tyrosine-protein phosphatase 1 [Pseudozyma hubeiensis]
MALGVRPSRQALSSLYQALDFTDHLRLTQPDLGYTTNHSSSSTNTSANRYRDILAYDHALLPQPYLNAAFIPPFPSTSISFIVSQAPLPQTYTAFYTHVVQQRVRVLVNLTPLVEKGRAKSDQYWPDEGKELSLENGWKVKNQSEKTIELDKGKATLIRRVIHIDSITDAQLSEHGWSVTQFHLTTWPDHGVFPTTLLLQLMHETQQVAMTKIYPPPPTWIHCSAGVGRSGTLAAAYVAQAVVGNAKQNQAIPRDSLMGRNASAEVWDLPVRIVEHLRRYRARMVQTIEQFEAVYEIVAELGEQAELVGK